MCPLTRLVLVSSFSLLVPTLLAGCGAGRKVVSHVEFEHEVVNGEVELAMDATLAPGGLVLPKASFPLYNPKNPSQTLGTIRTDGLHVIVSVNASEALRLPDLADGATLPNGAGIPLVLPTGLEPIGIPVFNSNSRVYVAVNGDQILLGAAVAIAKEDRLNLPLSIFLPFTVSREISGTGGFFLGEKQGLAVFALREKISMPIASAKASGISTAPSMRMANDFVRRAKIEVKEESISRSKVRRLERTWNDLRRVRID
jgi:hypothetical protein